MLLSIKLIITKKQFKPRLGEIINNNDKKQFKPRLGEIILTIITKTIQTSSRLLVEVATCKVRKPPSSEMMGKTTNGTATEGILIETDTRFSRVATWTFSTKRRQEADGDTCEEAIANNGFGLHGCSSPSTFTRLAFGSALTLMLHVNKNR
jgi:hypothetical protein